VSRDEAVERGIMQRLREMEKRLETALSLLHHELGPVYCFDSVKSTMDTAFGMEAAEIGDKTIIFSDRQTRGRGRHGRKWYSAKGSLIFSIILTAYDIRIPYSMVASYALYRAFTRFTQDVRLKWINDILWENGKKIAGVLTEERKKRTVIGMGINLNNVYIPSRVSRIATSYYIETGNQILKEEFLVTIMDELLTLLGNVENNGTEEILAAWENDAGIRNRSVKVVNGEREIFGTALGIDKKTGALRVKAGKEEIDFYEGTLFYT
jgi:BirA family biotin operon repressor/biotin-[acetyl-CoA-carboxylase] ligase